MSNNLHSVLLSPNLKPLPIDCKTLILLLEGDEKIILCKFLILIPVEKVPYDATMIASLDFSVIALISYLVNASTPPLTKKTFLSL